MASEFAKNIDENPTRARRDRLDRLKARYRWPAAGIEERGVHRYSPFHPAPVGVEEAPGFSPTAVPEIPAKSVLQSLGRGDDCRVLDEAKAFEGPMSTVGPKSWYSQYLWGLAKDARRIRPPIGWGMTFKETPAVRPGAWQFLNRAARKTLFPQTEHDKWPANVPTVDAPRPPKGFVHATPMQEYEDAKRVVQRAFKPFGLMNMRRKIRALNAKRGDKTSRAVLSQLDSPALRAFSAASRRLEALGHYEHLGARPGRAVRTDNMHLLALDTLAKNPTATHEDRARMRSTLARSFSGNLGHARFTRSTSRYMKRIEALARAAGQARPVHRPRRGERRTPSVPQSVLMAYTGGLTLV